MSRPAVEPDVVAYFQSDRQKPARPRVRPTATFFARRTIRFGLPDAARVEMHPRVPVSLALAKRAAR